MKIEKILALLCVFCFGMGLVTGVSAESDVSAVSPALNVISENSYVALSTVADKSLSFEAEDFERALNLSYISCITVNSLPDKSEGVLYLGGSEVCEGQTVSRANIGRLNFEFNGEDIRRSSFCFSPDYSGYDVRCNLFALKYSNSAPEIDADREASVSTYKSVSLYGRLNAFDKEGDDVFFEVIKQPKNGLLRMNESGEYVYTPQKGFCGSDSFKFVAVDEYGNYSSSKELRLKVEQQSSSLVFSDMTSDEYHVAAINLTEKGIMPTFEADGKYYFHPHTAVSRIEFLVMAMKNLGIKADGVENTTVFADDGMIPANLKGYVNTALELGIVSGKIDADGNLIFAPEDKITKAEAAVILNNMTELEMPVLTPVFADEGSLPAWAREAIICLSYNRILPCDGGYIAANEELDRDECAYMIYMIGNKIQGIN